MAHVRKRENNILAYQQNGLFYNRLANKCLEKQDLPAAMEYARRALIEDPDNEAFRVDLAEVFSSMHLYDRSNQILMPVIANGSQLGSECTYYLGYNFLMMGDYLRSLRSLSRYLEVNPDGEFAEDAEDMMTSIYDYFEEVGGLTSAEQLADEGKIALDQGDYPKAISRFEEALSIDPGLYYARNNLAICQFIREDVEGALLNTSIVLEDEPDNIFALCNMALFYKYSGQEAEYETILSAMEKAEPYGTQEILRLGTALGECERDEAAFRVFRHGVDAGEYDSQIQLYAGIAAYNCGRYQYARHYFSLLARWEAEKSIPAYYRNLSEIALKQGKKQMERLPYQYQVPIQEIASRITAISRVIQQGNSAVKEIFLRDQEFQSHVFWGLTLQENTVRSACIEILSIVGNNQCILILEDMLLSPDWNDEVKNELLMALSRTGRKEPYLALMDDAIVQAKVAVYDFPKMGEAYYRCVIEKLVGVLRSNEMEVYLDDTIELFCRYVRSHGEEDGDWPPAEDIGAALTYLAMASSGHAPIKRHLSLLFDTTVYRMNRMLHSLEEDSSKSG